MFSEEGEQAIDLSPASGNQNHPMLIAKAFKQAQCLAEGGASDPKTDAARELGGK